MYYLVFVQLGRVFRHTVGEGFSREGNPFQLFFLLRFIFFFDNGSLGNTGRQRPPREDAMRFSLVARLGKKKGNRNSAETAAGADQGDNCRRTDQYYFDFLYDFPPLVLC